MNTYIIQVNPRLYKSEVITYCLYGFAIKAFLAVIGGVIITPISLIYNLVMVHAYEKANGMTGKRSTPQKQRPNTSNVYDAAFVEEKNGTDGVA